MSSSKASPKFDLLDSHHDDLDRFKDAKNVGWTFLSGCLGGLANIIVGHPLDTIKVRMQMLNLGFFQCIKNMLTQEGIFSFYKGIGSPLYSIPLAYTILMGSYEVGRMIQGIGIHDQVSTRQGCISGAFAGMASCLVLTPVELVKCQMQMEINPKNGKHSTVIQATRKIIKQSGFKGLYKGNLISVLRETPGCAVHFATYEYFKKKLNQRFGENELNLLIAGGIAGPTGWIVSYPQDMIKTKLQCDLGLVKLYPRHRFLKDGGIIACMRDIWKKEGIKGFWRGYNVCAGRALVAEAFTFLVYEKAKKKFIDKEIE